MPICSFVQPRRRSVASRLGVTASGRVSTTRPTQRCSAASFSRCRASSWENVAVCHCAAAAQPLSEALPCKLSSAKGSEAASCVSSAAAEQRGASMDAALRSVDRLCNRALSARVPQAYRFRTVSL